jgi:hypothetical protein
MNDQLFLFPEWDVKPKIISGDAIDISTINIFFEGEKEIHRKSNVMVDKLKSLAPNKFYAFKSGENGYPYVKNIDTGTIYSINSPKTHGARSRNQYPCVGIPSVTVACHRLFALLFIENPNTELYTEVNHIDEDTENYRLENLEWITIAEHRRRHGRKRKTKDKSWIKRLLEL